MIFAHSEGLRADSSSVNGGSSPNSLKVSQNARLLNLAVIGLMAFWWAGLVGTRFLRMLDFDDSYMFYRYAWNMQHGLGISWNLDGIHTYGETSQLWNFVIFLLSLLPISASHALMLGSGLCSVGAIAAIAWAVARNSRSAYMSGLWRVVPLVALPLLFSKVYFSNAINGMETMLSVMLGGIFVGLALLWSSGRSRPEVVALVGSALFLTRPEAAIAVVSMIALLFFLKPDGVILSRRSSLVRETAILAAILGGVILLDFVVCKFYFNSALPLSFYMKSKHGYEGYIHRWYPVASAVAMMAMCRIYLVVLAFFGRRSDWRLVICCIAPALLAFMYLFTITQVMGFESRYYLPYLGFFVVPALLMVDRFLFDLQAQKNKWWSSGRFYTHALAVVCVIFILIPGRMQQWLVDAADRRVEVRSFGYVPAELQISASASLPETEYWPTLKALSDTLLSPLPTGVTIAASEVGYLGASGRRANVIDLAGLNDTEIAHDGFSMPALLARRPDIIWFPHSDYTYQRGVMFSDPALLRDYDLFAGAANYGLAIRKESPYRAQIDRQLEIFWQHLYPGYRMNDYKVSFASWTQEKYKLGDHRNPAS